MLERTQVFVDTSYLLASFYNSWETGARAQLEIDLPEVVAVLGSMITNQLDQPIHRQFWYDGIPDSGPHRYQRALRTCDGVLLRAGQLIEWGDRRTQKAVDTRLVVDMVLAAVRQQCSDIVLVSGDADMIPGVQEATNAGIRVHLYGFGWDSMSSALRHACDTTTILDPREDFAECMQLQVLEGPVPPTVRTKPIGDAEPLDDPSPTTVPSSALRPTAPPAATSTPAETTGNTVAEPAEEVAEPVAPVPVPENRPTPNILASPDHTEVASPDSSPCVAADAGSVDEEAANSTAQFPPTTPTARGEAEPQYPVDSWPEPAEEGVDKQEDSAVEAEARKIAKPGGPPKPSMMAPRRKLRSRYVPLPNEVWASDGSQTPFDVGQQYASWWYDNAATLEQRDQAHLLSGGGLPPEIDRPLLQFACETLHEYTLSEAQRVNLRDGFHAGIRGVLLHRP